MADQAERDEGNGQRPGDSALSFRTAGGTDFSINDPWTARIMMTAASGAGIYVVRSLVLLLRENPEVVKSAVRLAFQAWGEVKDVTPGSMIVDLDCGSKERFLKFRQDLEDGKVKDAMEKKFKEKGFNAELKFTLIKETPRVARMEMSKESVLREITKITYEVESHEERKAGKESDQKAEVREGPQEEDNPEKEDFQSPSQKRKEARYSAEVEQEEEFGSATKKRKLQRDPVIEPGTYGVSSTSKTKMEEKVSDDDHQELGRDIGLKWDRLARRLGIDEPDIQAIDKKYDDLPLKGYHALRLWSTINGEKADYKTLHEALVHHLVQRRDLAEKYCKQRPK